MALQPLSKGRPMTKSIDQHKTIQEGLVGVLKHQGAVR